MIPTFLIPTTSLAWNSFAMLVATVNRKKQSNKRLHCPVEKPGWDKVVTRKDKSPPTSFSCAIGACD
jgi:hypothetical protein